MSLDIEHQKKNICREAPWTDCDQIWCWWSRGRNQLCHILVTDPMVLTVFCRGRGVKRGWSHWLSLLTPCCTSNKLVHRLFHTVNNTGHTNARGAYTAMLIVNLWCDITLINELYSTLEDLFDCMGLQGPNSIFREIRLRLLVREKKFHGIQFGGGDLSTKISHAPNKVLRWLRQVAIYSSDYGNHRLF